MTLFRLSAAAAILVCIPIGLFAEETAYVIAKDFSAEGKVLELEVPPEIDGTRFYFVFQNNDSQPHVEVVLARAGKHCYETRYLSEWQGRIKFVAVSLKGIKGAVKYPTLADELDMFLEPDPITLLNINVLSQHRVAAWSWTACLLLFFSLFTLCFLIFGKKPAVIAVILGFVAASVLMDLRSVIDHAFVVYKEETLHSGMPPLNEAKIFADAAADLIGSRPWAMGTVEIGAKLFQYRLAEHTYAASGSSTSPAVWITQHPAEGQAFFQSGKYYLVQKEKP